jgi:hypothetical protein
VKVEKKKKGRGVLVGLFLYHLELGGGERVITWLLSPVG